MSVRASQMMLHAAIGVASVLLVAPGVASAACPPLRSPWEAAKRFFESVYGPFDADVFAKLERAGLSALVVNPPRGAAPLTVKLQWMWQPFSDVTRVEIDLRGSGRADHVFASLRESYTDEPYTYDQPGRYDLTVHVTARSGHQRTFAVPIDVMSRADFDRDLQSRWDTFRDHIKRGDAVGALECVYSASRARYREAFDALSHSLTKVGDDMGPITLVDHHRTFATYRALRTDRGTTYSFEVVFEPDSDGVWRISSF